MPLEYEYDFLNDVINFDLLFQNIIFKVRASFFDSLQHVIFMVKLIWFNVF